MSWIQTGSIIGSIGTAAYILWKQLHEYRSEMREDIKIQSQRSDKLYEMFIDLVKEGRK